MTVPSAWISPGVPAIVLAPMEGVTDAPMRELLTELGGFSFCVTEFLRVSREVPPNKVFFRHVPEISMGSTTRSGIPTQIQLLGGSPDKVAESALRAVHLGVKAIDLNFGCPAPTVNRHDGGATLLKYPNRLKDIVSACRERVPSSIPVSAKLRLGWENPNDILINAEKVVEGGASWITIHARTRTQGYSPPAHWKFIRKVKENVSIPIVANGEIWTLDDFKRCADESGCEHFMLGRGALSDPYLAHQIGRLLKVKNFESLNDSPFGVKALSWLPLLSRFSQIAKPFAIRPGFIPQKIKQWVNLASKKNDVPWFHLLKKLETTEAIFELLKYFNEQ